MTILQFDNLSCERSGRILFRSLGFCLQPGAFLLLLGRNGCGKTSLLQLLAGLSKPQTGQVCWNDTPVYQQFEYRKQLLFLGHRNALNPAQTVSAHLQQYARQQDSELMLKAALRYFDLEEYADTPCWQLSAGWQRKVALARLILSRAKVWLLDEPTNFLDEAGIARVQALLETRVEQGGIVVVASHSLRSGNESHMLKIEDFA